MLKRLLTLAALLTGALSAQSNNCYTTLAGGLHYQCISPVNQLIVQPLTADPTVLLEGDLWFNGTTNQLKFYDGTTTNIISPPTGGPGGGVSSVGLSLPSSIFAVSGSPVTSSGSLTGAFATGQAANRVFGTDGSGNVGLMVLTTTQLPSAASIKTYLSLAAIASSGSASDLTTGTVAVARLPVATSAALGVTKPDNSSVTVSVGGVLSSVPNANVVQAWGDSLTQGNQDGQGDSWPQYISLNYGTVGNNYGIGGITSATVLSMFQATSPLNYRGKTVLWAGRNDVPSFTGTLSNVSTMAAALPAGALFLTPSIVNSEIEPSGSSNYNAIVAYNATLLAAFPSNYLDIRGLLVAGYNPAIPMDVYDNGRDVPAYSLRSTFSGTITTALTDTTGCTFTTAGTGFLLSAVLKVDSEYILETAGSGFNTTACTRGYGGSTATTHSASAAITVTDPLHYNAAGYLLIANAYAAALGIVNTPASIQLGVTSDGLSNTFVGTNSHNKSLVGIQNTVVGNSSFQANTTGNANSIFGWNTLAKNTTGLNNSAFGASALTATTTGTNNSGFGVSALVTNTTGSSNVAFGANSLNSNTTASDNDAFGRQAMSQNTTGAQNVAFGSNSNQLNTTGSNNSAFGYRAGLTATSGNANLTGSGNTYVGSQSGPSSATQQSHETVIGADATAACSNCIVLGRAGATDVVIENAEFTVATLPAAASFPRACTWVSDGAAIPVYLVTAAGGGSLHLRVCSDGTNWQNH